MDSSQNRFNIVRHESRHRIIKILFNNKISKSESQSKSVKSVRELKTVLSPQGSGGGIASDSLTIIPGTFSLSIENLYEATSETGNSLTIIPPAFDL